MAAIANIQRLAQRPAFRPPAPARPAQGKPGRVARAGNTTGTSCGLIDPESTPGRLAPVAAVAALGSDLPDLPEARPLAEPCAAYGPRAGAGCALPRGFFLDRYVY